MRSDASIPAMAQSSAARWGDAAAVVDGATRLSFADVADEMLRVARALAAVGVGPGDRVAIWAPNSASFITAALGIQAAGAWLVPLNTRFRGEEAAYILGKVDARVLFSVEGFLGTDYEGMLRAADPELRALERVVHLPGPGERTTLEWEAFLTTGDATPAGEVQARIDALGPDDVCDVIFTSGTTGLPKGVMLRHGPSLWGFGIYNETYGLVEGTRQLVITPFFHCFGYKAGWMIGLMYGARTYPLATFDPVEAMRVISEAGITHMPGSPTMFSAILDHPDRGQHDLSTLGTSLISAATVPARLLDRVRHELGVERTLTGYGLTENHALVSVSLPDDSVERVSTTSGRVLDGLEVRVVDDEGNDVVTGESGELLVSGPLLMSGYYEDEPATAATVVDGWLHTGDVVRLSSDRYLTITDRKKDIYIMGGFNVAPAEVERVLLDLDGVAQVAVVGVPDEHFGQVGVAFVVPSPGAALTGDDVITHAREHLANYKVPRRVELLKELPLNATGKVLKHVLRDGAAVRRAEPADAGAA